MHAQVRFVPPLLYSFSDAIRGLNTLVKDIHCLSNHRWLTPASDSDVRTVETSCVCRGNSDLESDLDVATSQSSHNYVVYLLQRAKLALPRYTLVIFGGCGCGLAGGRGGV